MEDELDMEVELERELAQEQMEEEEEELCMQLALEQDAIHRPLAKVLSLPANFTFSSYESPTRGRTMYNLLCIPLIRAKCIQNNMNIFS